LSACRTNVGDEKSPDESIHLAAAMQFSGLRSAIGFMWSVEDEASKTYSWLSAIILCLSFKSVKQGFDIGRLVWSPRNPVE
ncbi:uncharacterized protein F5891DRAFT_960302, partial [Suillus fuscotomentosus]